MDEPFSAVDYERASILTNAITTNKVFKSKTVVMITHNISKENIEKFDYLVNQQSDELIDNDELAYNFLIMLENLIFSLKRKIRKF